MIGGLPGKPERIRRRYWRDPGFRTVCGDYREALEVLARLERATPPPAARLEEYRKLAAELLAEASEMLANEGP